MRKSILLTGLLSTLTIGMVAHAVQAPVNAVTKSKSNSFMTATANVGFISDYYTPGIHNIGIQQLCKVVLALFNQYPR